MKTKFSFIAILFFLSVSICFSQTDLNSDKEASNEENSLIAMYLKTEQANLSSKGSPANTVITTYPEFIGDGRYTSVNEYIYKNLKFPEEARITGRAGLVKVQFDIYTDGLIGNIKIVESPDKTFNQEVMTLLSQMPKWKPAYSGVNPVKSRYQLNINFSLQ